MPRLACLLLVWPLLARAEVVNLEVYGESQCTDTAKFLHDQLVPFVTNMDTYLNLTLNIYGKARRINSTAFECQHGPIECAVNQIQLCGVLLSPNSIVAVDFVNCMQMKTVDGLNFCAWSTALHEDDIRYCYDKGQGLDLMQQAGQRTDMLEPKLIRVPTIVINGHQDPLAEYSLAARVCASFAMKPPGC